MTEFNPTLNALPLDAKPDEKTRVKAQATDAAIKFEAFFIKQLLTQMRSSTRALADEDSAENKHANQDMLDMADGMVADALAKRRAFGIADMMLKQVLPAAGLSPDTDVSPSTSENHGSQKQ